MSKKLFVGNLPFSMTEDALHALFAAKGKVTSTKLITDKYSGQSRGFGFVEMADDTEAEAAIQAMNNSSIEGRAIVVNEARPMKDKGPRNFSGGNQRFSKERRPRW